MPPAKETGAYARAGVDIGLGNRVKSTLPKLLAATHRPGVLGQVGGFGGLFELDTRRYRRPVLVSSVDGVGTKLKVAFAMGRHDTVGHDLVNHCVNDIVVLGAEPLFFLDYLGTGQLDGAVFTDIIRGFAAGCVENHCALIAGETAQMPGFYQPGEYDLSGTIVGVVEKNRMLDGPRSVRAGDLILGLASNGLHTNGYSLARRICFEQLGLQPSDHVPELGGCVGEELLRGHLSYGRAILGLLRKFNQELSPRRRPVRAIAHITGGGFLDNIPRVLPSCCDAVIGKGTWPMPPVFPWLQRHGGVEELEMYRVFNMGVGMVLIVQAGKESLLLRTLQRLGRPAWVIGEVTSGTGRVRLRD